MLDPMAIENLPDAPVLLHTGQDIAATLIPNVRSTLQQLSDSNIIGITYSRKLHGAELDALAFVVDISDRKRVENELRRSEERYRSIVENTHEGICTCDDNRFRHRADCPQRSCARRNGARYSDFQRPLMGQLDE